MASILHRVGIDASVDAVYQALTTLEALEGNRGWWDSKAVGDAEKGGTMTFFERVDLEVLEAHPSGRVTWRCVRGPEEWMDTEIRFELVRRQEQTFVMFTHADWRAPVEFMHHCSTRWATFLLSLKAFVETGKGRPAPDDVRVYVGE